MLVSTRTAEAYGKAIIAVILEHFSSTQQAPVTVSTSI